MNEDAIRRYMEQNSSPPSSPTHSATQKRTIDDLQSDDEAEGDENAPPPTSDQVADNMVANNGFETPDRGVMQPHTHTPFINASRLREFIAREAKKRKLPPEIIDKCQNWGKRTPLERDALLYMEVVANNGKLDHIIAAQPAYKVSDHLKKSIDTYSLGTLLSTKLSQYKGNETVTITENLLKKYCAAELPPNPDRSPADWALVHAAVQYAQTQIRAKWKKAIIASVKYPTDAKCTDIYDLALGLAGKTQVTPEFCARVAIMRQVYSETSDKNFWVKVDARLKFLRDQAKELGGGTAEARQRKLDRAMRGILTADRQRYGSKSSEKIEESAVEEFQQEINDALPAEV